MAGESSSMWWFARRVPLTIIMLAILVMGFWAPMGLYPVWVYLVVHAWIIAPKLQPEFEQWKTNRRVLAAAKEELDGWR
jgi:hypothetical protein